MTKIVSWNVNGIRSVFKTTFLDWLKKEDPDIVCLQETKCDFTELDDAYTKIDGYYAYFHSSSLRKGHAGVAVYTKIKPRTVETRLGIERFDDEGRCLKLTFDDFTLYNFYIPHGGRAQDDLAYKLGVYERLLEILRPLPGQNVILAGDFNIAHTEMDLCHPKQNKDNIMFTPAERKKISDILALGYVDAFREKCPEKKAYTWWSYAYNARENDIGWRIDYFFISKSLQPLLREAFMRRETLGSDHGPLGIVLDLKIEKAEEPVYERKAETLF